MTEKQDLFSKLVGETVLIDEEGYAPATWGRLKGVDETHLELSSAIRVRNYSDEARGFEGFVNRDCKGRIILCGQMGKYLLGREQAKRIVPYKFDRHALSRMPDDLREFVEQVQ